MYVCVKGAGVHRVFSFNWVQDRSRCQAYKRYSVLIKTKLVLNPSMVLYFNLDQTVDTVVSYKNIVRGVGGGSTKCHVNFFCYLNSEFKAFRSINSSLR